MAGKSSVKRSGISGMVKALIEKAVTDAGYELWDVDYVKEGTDYNLVITIDKKPLVTISDCEKVTRLIDPILDEADPIPDSYYLEVSSAGSERDLKRPEHFECYKGKKIKIGLFKALTADECGNAPELAGTKALCGILSDYTDSEISVDIGENKIISVEMKKCSFMRADDADDFVIGDIKEASDDSEE